MFWGNFPLYIWLHVFLLSARPELKDKTSLFFSPQRRHCFCSVCSAKCYQDFSVLSVTVSALYKWLCSHYASRRSPIEPVQSLEVLSCLCRCSRLHFWRLRLLHPRRFLVLASAAPGRAFALSAAASSQASTESASYSLLGCCLIVTACS